MYASSSPSSVSITRRGDPVGSDEPEADPKGVGPQARIARHQGNAHDRREVALLGAERVARRPSTCTGALYSQEATSTDSSVERSSDCGRMTVVSATAPFHGARRRSEKADAFQSSRAVVGEDEALSLEQSGQGIDQRDGLEPDADSSSRHRSADLQFRLPA
jgi:hypothetical protein